MNHNIDDGNNDQRSGPKLKSAIPSTAVRSTAMQVEEERPRFRSMAIVDVSRPPRIGGVVDRASEPPVYRCVKLVRPAQIAAAEKVLSSNIQADFRKNDATHSNKEVRCTNWVLKEGSLRLVPTYYPLEKSSRYITGKSVEEITKMISDCCRIMSIHAEYETNEDIPGSAYLRTSEHVEFQLNLWQGTAPKYPDCVIVEAQRRRGDAVTFHKYCRHILDAADGIFSSEAFISLEDQEAEYCRKAKEMLVQGKKPNAEGSNTVIKNALLALEIAATLLKKDRMDARQLGMESLCLLTDPTRTGVETALISSRVVLTGSTQEADDDDEYDAREWGIREAIIDLVQFGQLNEDGAFDNDAFDDDSSAQCYQDEQRRNGMLHNLALAVLANALDMLKIHGRGLCEAVSASPSSVAESFLGDADHMVGRELLKAFLGKLDMASAKPHDATLSAKCLKLLCEASEDARRRARDLKAKQIVQTALEVGQRMHVKLEKESQKAINALSRIEDDFELYPQA